MAIAFVLLSHTYKLLPANLTFGYDAFLWSFGVLGVELFFALSGFLIGGLLLDIHEAGANWPTVKIFVLRRWLRTLPLYYVVLIALWLFPSLDPVPPGDMWTYFTMTQNLLSALDKWNWFGISWSLPIEEWSYLLLPFLAFVCFRRHAHRVAIAAAVLIVAGLMFRLALADPWQYWDDVDRKVVLTRLDAIAFGVLLAWSYRRFGSVLVRHYAGLLFPVSVFLILSTWTICVHRDEGLFTVFGMQGFYSRVLMLPLVGAALAGCLPLVMGWSAPKIVEAPIQLTARLSYALYLVHWPMMHMLDSVPQSFKITAFFGGSFILAAMLSYAIEQPLMRLRPQSD